ncbi:UDP-glucose 4-epimerase GalE [Sphingomonas sanguinis]|jgi:UDP-arabinose 4-epimerase|uniref:UDP-glucose 4-epimerase n=1 Tax=Sphingomonas sanguinis TaxID=33051 RepID=A0A7Y7URK2_9SPHN|nr:UDP-glucose 4-epimerase GalE [Sphingomonas sanguinis]MBZ6383105.1 UDP-glucose 4-epimerase GalE [Sphingomonas sanguinis]NNG48167.1 UDP-glucose 4-epimerase GalE [Sphingomonas sanguinis]NNG54913.1 UDP-glucose 4-epimerase GalE [Sphingomonas sanguinis]NVP32402.1 UDP-glucose 4-epimerase GalE [Sphingomonas sanguinis]
MGMSILVTGGGGYIGSHACKALAAAGFLPISFDNLASGKATRVRWGPLVQGDVRDSAAVRDAIERHRARAVIHFAADAYVGQSVTDPARYYDNNVGGMTGLLAGMRAAGCGLIVFSSTCAVYGSPVTMPITEETPTTPVNPYGRTKLVCEGMLGDYAAAYGIRSVALRYFNASGADPDGDLGEDREDEPHLIPRAMMHLLGRIPDFAVYGSDFPTPDGTAIRDYVHVTDLARAHVLAVRQLVDGRVGQRVFNLGSGTGHSVAEVLAEISLVSGRALAAPRGPRRSGDPARLIADATRARRDLNFSTTHSTLHEIVTTAWRWHRSMHGESAATIP